MLPMKSSYIQQGLDGQYSAQTNLIGFFYLLDIFVGRAFHWFQFFLHLQCLASLDVSLLFEGLDHLRQLTFFLLSLGRASSTRLSSANRVSLCADRSEIFCFSISPEDFRMPMLLCFSLARCFTFITSSESWA